MIGYIIGEFADRMYSFNLKRLLSARDLNVVKSCVPPYLTSLCRYKSYSPTNGFIEWVVEIELIGK